MADCQQPEEYILTNTPPPRGQQTTYSAFLETCPPTDPYSALLDTFPAYDDLTQLYPLDSPPQPNERQEHEEKDKLVLAIRIELTPAQRNLMLKIICGILFLIFMFVIGYKFLPTLDMGSSRLGKYLADMNRALERDRVRLERQRRRQPIRIRIR